MYTISLPFSCLHTLQIHAKIVPSQLRTNITITYTHIDTIWNIFSALTEQSKTKKNNEKETKKQKKIRYSSEETGM